jgi:hypothetical protein
LSRDERDVTEARTEGERLFEQYLDEMQYAYEFEKEFEGKKKRPDYAVTKGGGTFLFDAKDFDPMTPKLGFSQFDPYSRLRQRIDDGRKKFKEFKEFPCCIVLRNTGNAFVNVESPAIVIGAMYGDAGFKIPIYVGPGTSSTPPRPPQQAFLEGGKMVYKHKAQNTTISALITLRYIAVGMCRVKEIFKEHRHLSIPDAIEAASERFPSFDVEERRLGVIVWENALARIPLSRDLFTGPYDLRWGVESSDQKIVFEGEALRELITD